MPAWVHDEAIWEKAKARVREQYPKVSEDEDQFYALTTAIYKKMGGQVRTAKCLLSFGKAHIKGHYRTDPTTGQQVYVKEHQDARPEAQSREPFRMWRVQGSTIRHAQPGAKLTREQAESIRELLRVEGAEGGHYYRPVEGTLQTQVSSPRLDELWRTHGSERVRTDRISAIRAKQDEDNKARRSELLRQQEGAPASPWIEEVFGHDTINPYNTVALSRFLEGETTKYEGLVNHTWVDGIEKLGARDGEKIDWRKVKYAYEAWRQKRTDPTTGRPVYVKPHEDARLAAAAHLDAPPGLSDQIVEQHTREQVVERGPIGADAGWDPAATAKLREDESRAHAPIKRLYDENMATLNKPDMAAPPPVPKHLIPLAEELVALADEPQPADSGVSPETWQNYTATTMMAAVYRHFGVERNVNALEVIKERLADAGFPGAHPVKDLLDAYVAQRGDLVAPSTTTAKPDEAGTQPASKEPWDMNIQDFIAEHMRGKTISRTLPTYKYNQEVERAKALYGEHIRQAIEAGKPVRPDMRHWSGYKAHLLPKQPEAAPAQPTKRGSQLDLFKAGLRRLRLFFKSQLRLPLHDEKVPVEGHMRGSTYVAPHQATRYKTREKSDEPEKPKALAVPEREKYPDGRLTPIDGDKVWQLVPGFGGTPAYIYGEVYRRGKDLRVWMTGSASLIGGGVAGPKTVALSPHWTVKGDPRIKEREAERERARWEAEAKREADQATQQEASRRKAAASLQRAVDRGERAPEREDIQQGAWVTLHEPATGETRDIIVYRVEEREPDPPQVLYREQGGAYPFREAEPGTYRATLEAQYAMPLSHVLEVGTVEPGQDVDGQWAAEVRQTEAEAEAYEREERERQAKYEQDRAAEEAQAARFTQMEARIKAAVRRYQQDGTRAIQWAWDAMSAKERADMDTLLVDIEHPLARQAGTAESRFTTLVQDVLRDNGLLAKSLWSWLKLPLLFKAKNPDLIPKPTQVSGHERTVGGVTHWISPHASIRYTRPGSPFTKIGTRHDVSFDEIREVAGQAEQQWPESYNAKLMGVLMHPHVYAIWEKQNRTTTAPRYGFAHRVRQVRNDRYGPGYVVEQVAKTPKGESVAPWNSLRDDYYSHHPDNAWHGISRNTKHQFVVDLYMLAHGADAELIERESRPLWDAMRHGLKLVRSRAIPEGYGVGDRIQRADDSVHTVVGGQDGYLVLEDEQSGRSLLSPEAITRGASIKLSPLQKAHVKTYTRKDGTLVREHEDTRRSARPEGRRARRRGEDQTAILEHRPSAEFMNERMKRYGYVQHEGRWVKTPAQTSERPTPMTTPQPAVQPVTPAEPGHLDSWLEEINQAPDIQAAMREVLEGTPTVHLHRLEDGDYTPERTRLHESIIASMLNPRAVVAEGQRPQAVVFLGRPGSGKTSALGPAAKDLGVEFTTINADDVKAKLPEYTGRNAGLVHEESSDIAEGMLFRKALDAGHHVILDITGGNQQKVEGMVDRFHRAGYEISIMFADLPLEKACARVVERFRRTGRFVPPSYVAVNVDHKPDRTYNALKEDPRVSHWRRYNTDVERTHASALQEEGRRQGGHASSEPGTHAFSKSAAAGDALTRGPDRRALRADGGDPERQDHGDARPLSQPPALARILTHSAALQRTLCKSIETLDQDLRSPDLDPASRGVLLAERLSHLERLEALQARLQEVGV